MTDRKCIITCAVTGASLTPSMSQYLPVTPKEIGDQAVEAIDAGAAIIHAHARMDDGRPTNDVEIWRGFIPRLQNETDAIVNMSASLGSSADDRLKAVLELRPDVATVIVGSMNYGLFNKAKNQGVTEFKADWEKQAFGPRSYEIVTQNSFATIGRMIDILVDQDIAMEFECYDVGHLYILDYHLNAKPGIKRPVILQFLTGILGGIPSEIDHLLHMKRTSERLFGEDIELFTHGTGTGNIKAATYGAMMGTHIRVGQEDNLFDVGHKPFPSNAAQVEKMVRILGELGIPVAAPDEAREVLGLKR